MAMYVQLLSAGLTSDCADAYAPGELLSLARRRRHQMLTSTGHSHLSAERDLAYDVNYDCALIRLCAAVGVETAPTSFGQPGVERGRLERALAEAGIDLAHVEIHH